MRRTNEVEATNGTITATAAQALTLCHTAWDADVPVLLIGAPGIGKTDVIKEAARTWRGGTTLYASHPVVEDSTYPTGLPWADRDGEIAFRPFGVLRDVLTCTDARCVWLLDDFGQAPASVQAAYMNALLSRRTAGGMALPSGLRWALATNRRTDRAAVQGVLSPVVSRCLLVNVEVDAASWLAWATRESIDPRVIGYIRAVPSALADNAATLPDLTAYACPRTWHRVSNVLSAAPTLDGDARMIAFAGLLGAERASEFCSFLTLAATGMPTFEDVIADPLHATLPAANNAMLCYAVSAMLAARVDAATIDRAYPYIERLPVEYRVTCVADAYRRQRAIMSTPAFRRFCESHPNVFTPNAQ